MSVNTELSPVQIARAKAGLPPYRPGFMRHLKDILAGYLTNVLARGNDLALLNDFSLSYAALDAKKRELEVERSSLLRQIDHYKEDGAQKDSIIAIRETEIRELSLVIERNRLRVEKEMALAVAARDRAGLPTAPGSGNG